MGLIDLSWSKTQFSLSY